MRPSLAAAPGDVAPFALSMLPLAAMTSLGAGGRRSPSSLSAEPALLGGAKAEAGSAPPDPDSLPGRLGRPAPTEDKDDPAQVEPRLRSAPGISEDPFGAGTRRPLTQPSFHIHPDGTFAFLMDRSGFLHVSTEFRNGKPAFDLNDPAILAALQPYVGHPDLPHQPVEAAQKLFGTPEGQDLLAAMNKRYDHRVTGVAEIGDAMRRLNLLQGFENELGVQLATYQDEPGSAYTISNHKIVIGAPGETLIPVLNPHPDRNDQVVALTHLHIHPVEGSIFTPQFGLSPADMQGIRATAMDEPMRFPNLRVVSSATIDGLSGGISFTSYGVSPGQVHGESHTSAQSVIGSPIPGATWRDSTMIDVTPDKIWPVEDFTALDETGAGYTLSPRPEIEPKPALGQRALTALEHRTWRDAYREILAEVEAVDAIHDIYMRQGVDIGPRPDLLWAMPAPPAARRLINGDEATQGMIDDALAFANGIADVFEDLGLDGSMAAEVALRLQEEAQPGRSLSAEARGVLRALVDAFGQVEGVDRTPPDEAWFQQEMERITEP